MEEHPEVPAISEKKGTVSIHSHFETLNFWINLLQVCLDWQSMESLSQRVSGIVMSAAAYRAVCTPAVEKVRLPHGELQMMEL